MAKKKSNHELPRAKSKAGVQSEKETFESAYSQIVLHLVKTAEELQKVVHNIDLKVQQDENIGKKIDSQALKISSEVVGTEKRLSTLYVSIKEDVGKINSLSTELKTQIDSFLRLYGNVSANTIHAAVQEAQRAIMDHVTCATNGVNNTVEGLGAGMLTNNQNLINTLMTNVQAMSKHAQQIVSKAQKTGDEQASKTNKTMSFIIKILAIIALTAVGIKVGKDVIASMFRVPTNVNVKTTAPEEPPS